MIDFVINFSYLIASILFILGLKLLNSIKFSKIGNIISAIGMIIAILLTFFSDEIFTYYWIFSAILIGTIIGILFSHFVKMTQMPEMVALLNGFGGIASLIVGSCLGLFGNVNDHFIAFVIFLSIFIGGITFSGSLIAWGKLNGKINSKSIIFTFQNIINAFLLFLCFIIAILYVITFEDIYIYMMVVLSLILGVLSVIPIGGADMPVVISLLNSYSGLAGCATGFALQNILLIVAGALVGASGIILTSIMCKAMNRSIAHVLFSGFGSVKKSDINNVQNKQFKTISVKNAYFVMEAARRIVIIPGYGLAVAQAQHVVKELANRLEENATEVLFAIHPVAGRMPGHMNVLLAEADISYEKLIEIDDINRIMNSVDLCIVIGANDVVNISARDDVNSAIYGMPIINVDKAKNVFVIKRSMNFGFSGIDNPLFYNDNTNMLFGDAKKVIQKLIDEF